MNAQALPDKGLCLVIMALVLFRQVVPRPVNPGRRGGRLVIVLGVLGAAETVHFWCSTGQFPALGFGASALSAGIGALLAGVRARAVRIWFRDGVWWQQGTTVAMLLWLLALGLHAGVEAAAGALDPAARTVLTGFGRATVLLYLAWSLALQQIALQHRISRRRVCPGPDLDRTCLVRTGVDQTEEPGHTRTAGSPQPTVGPVV